MANFKYIIVGGGMAADSAARGIRSKDASGAIALFSSENDKPYNRPPLSKKLWKGDSIDSIWRNTPSENLTMFLGTTVTAIDREKKTIQISDGREFGYDVLLLATGGTVRTLPFQTSDIIYYRTVADYRKVRELVNTEHSFLIIGGGFIGTEVAAALAMNDKQVTMIFPEHGIGERNYPKDLSEYITEYYKENKVTILSGDGVTGIKKDGSKFVVSTQSNLELHFDSVIAGIGITVNVDLAKASGLTIDNGIVVDEYCRTSDPSIFAAGDVANFRNQELGKRIRLEHEDNANHMGECAGKNMAGAEERYDYLPYFYSDLFDLGYEGIGELDSRHEMIADWKEDFKEGVIYYLEGDRIRGVLLWNVWEQIDAARKLVGDPGPFTKENVKGLIKM